MRPPPTKKATEERGQDIEIVRPATPQCAAVLSIKGEDYIVYKAEFGWAVESIRRDSAAYAVFIQNAVPYTCSCPDRKYRGNHCKHMRAVELLCGEAAAPRSRFLAGKEGVA